MRENIKKNTENKLKAPFGGQFTFVSKGSNRHWSDHKYRQRSRETY